MTKGIAIERIVQPAAPGPVGALSTGERFLDPNGELRRVVLPALSPDLATRPSNVLWDSGDQPPRIDGRVYTVLEADGMLELIPDDTWVTPVIDARLTVRILDVPPEPPPDPSPPPEVQP